ncbi:MAG: YjjG family noncanonical pyrimidine nucleotidase [Bacteroidales bacterium]|jgi:putative hydrolase of the HAD superfamily|nr:YjjG family noncanonical pyrimidine nucleotidase [Bacteroidales bacterium]MCI2121762.1 YjjG family noncanonical pyrimidine nucleotidase [Bacteroidales bacterium]MCI2145903.1 YjjG family noncanonical pyrimidine nucleotidase [Bacteroidales bacterium]
MKLHQYEFYLFDIDRTLFDFETNAKASMKMCLADFDVPVGDYEKFWADYQVINKHYWNLYESGKIDKDTLRSQRIYQAIKQILGIDDQGFSNRLEAGYLWHMGEMNGMMPHAKEVVVELKRRGKRLGIVSNGFHEVQYRKLRTCGIREYFDVVAISDEIGVVKPAPGIFGYAMNVLGGTKGNTIMVGDDPEVDIEGAQVFGIDQYYYNPGHVPCDCAPTYEGDDLRDLL